MDTRNLCGFVTSMNKFLENKSFGVPLQKILQRFRKFPELKIAEKQESMWQKYHLFLLSSYSSLIFFFFQQVSFADTEHTDIVWSGSWSNNVLSTPEFSTAASTPSCNLLSTPLATILLFQPPLCLMRHKPGILHCWEFYLLVKIISLTFVSSSALLARSIFSPQYHMCLTLAQNLGWQNCFMLVFGIAVLHSLMTDLSVLLQFWSQDVGLDVQWAVKLFLFFTKTESCVTLHKKVQTQKCRASINSLMNGFKIKN